MSTSHNLPHVILHVFDSFHTFFNKVSIARDYHHRPSYDPGTFMTIDQLSNIIHEPTATINLPSLPPAPPWPWKNMSIWRLMTWMMTSSRQKSEDEVTRLIHEVIQAEDFDHTHLDQFNAHIQLRKFDNSENTPGEDSTNVRQDSWKSHQCVVRCLHRSEIRMEMDNHSRYQDCSIAL
jgi:hypothetical protein